MKVIGLDPGVMSGIVLAGISGRDVLQVHQWAEADQLGTADFLRSAMTVAEVVVCESFKPRTGRALSFKPHSLELIGLARALCWWAGIPFVLQDPVMKERFHAAALEQFPEVGRGKDGHARDALAHVIGWAETRVLSVR